MNGTKSVENPSCNPDSSLQPQRSTTMFTPPIAENRPAYSLITTNHQLEEVIREVKKSKFIAIDTETSGLRPYHGQRIRLISLSTSTGRDYVIDCFQCNPGKLVRTHLKKKRIIAHNWAFDANFLSQYGFRFERSKLRDTFILAFLLHCGSKRPAKLDYCLSHYVGVEVDKQYQKSNWSGKLSQEQLDYAASDTKYLIDLYLILFHKIKKAGLGKIAALEHRVLRAVLWMQRSGTLVDSAQWLKIYEQAKKDRAHEDEAMRAMVPARSYGAKFNWRKTADIKSALLRLGHRARSTAKKKLALELVQLSGTPKDFIEALLRWRRADQIIKAFGPKWLQAVTSSGRVHANPQQCLPQTGRFSYSSPNLQQIPGGRHRKCFLARPGYSIIKADYSGIELRMMAWVSRDPIMIEAFQNGADLHRLTAQNVMGVAEPTKDERKFAKILNFGLLYGCGAETLQEQLATWGIIMTLEQCAMYKHKFFTAYRGIAAYLEAAKKKQDYAWRSPWGRRRLGMGPEFNKKTGRMQNQFNKNCNTPIQGTSADGMKQAIADVWKYRRQIPGVKMLMVVHDEIVLECPTPLAFQCSTWLRTIMINAMQPLLGTVPCEVEATIGQTWGG